MLRPKSSFIVSNKHLRTALLTAIPIETNDEREIAFTTNKGAVVIGGIPVTNEFSTDWEDFSIDRSKAMKLYELLRTISEQPITVSYMHGNIMISHIMV